MRTTEEILEFIKRTVQSSLPDSDVMLFGSRARSTGSDNSDYDILIVTKQRLSPKEKFPFRTQIRKTLLKQGILSDIIIQNKEELKRNQKLPGHIIRRILDDVVIL